MEKGAQAMSATNLAAHAVDIETGGTGFMEPGGPRYRWTCSCGCQPGAWKSRAFQARMGGAQHQRQMERARPARSTP